MKAKSSSGETFTNPRTDEDDIYYELTLDPTVKSHRVIALVIDYTSNLGDCSFYEPDDHSKYCSIAPEFRVIWDDCGGKCFVHGLTCPVILERAEELNESETDNGSSQEKMLKAKTLP